MHAKQSTNLVSISASTLSEEKNTRKSTANHVEDPQKITSREICKHELQEY